MCMSVVCAQKGGWALRSQEFFQRRLGPLEMGGGWARSSRAVLHLCNSDIMSYNIP